MSLAYHMCTVQRVDEENTDVLGLEYYYIRFHSIASYFQQFIINSYNPSVTKYRRPSLNWQIEKRF